MIGAHRLHCLNSDFAAIWDCLRATLRYVPSRRARGKANEELERPQAGRRARGHARASPADADPVLAAPRRAWRRRDRRHRHPHPHRGRRGQGRPGRHPLLRDRRADLRLRRARLCRSRDDDPCLGLGLHLFLCRVRRADRLDDRGCADPRIYAWWSAPSRSAGRAMPRAF